MKKLLKIIAAIIALVIIAALAAPMFISAEFVKAQLTEQVKKATGRTLTIEGKTSLSFFPNIAVKAENITLSNPAGNFASPYFVKVGTLSVGAALKPLLSKEIRVTGITIDRATLNLEQNGGAQNWAFPMEKKSGEKTNAKEKKEAGKQAAFSIDAIKIRNTAVSYRAFGAKPMKLDLKNIDADIAMRGEDVTVEIINTALYEGSAKGTVKKSGKASTALDLTFDGVQIDPLMTALTGASKLSGAATIALDVKGSGANADAIMRSLSGTGSMKIADGAIKGINIASFLRSAQKGFLLKDNTTEKTDFTELTASVKIAQGVVSNEDLAMKSPVLRLAGKGTVNLPNKTINYRAVPTLVATAQGQGGRDDAVGLAVPLLITGPWSAILVTPDVAGLLQEGLKNPEAIKQNIKNVKDAIGDLNSPKDLGKALFGGGKNQ